MPGTGLLDSKLMIILLYFLLPLIASVLAASSLLTAKVPNAKEVVGKILPYKAIIGVVALVVGFYHLLAVLFHEQASFGAFFESFPVSLTESITMLPYFIVTIGLILVGFMLGMGLIAKWIPGDSAPEEKALEVQQKLVKFEVPLGLILLIGAVWVLFNMPPAR